MTVRWKPLLSAVLLAIVLPTPSPSQQPDDDTPQLADVKAQRESIEKEEGLDATRRKALLAQYDKAIQFLERADASARRAAKFDAARRAAPNALAEAKAALARPVGTAAPSPPASMPLEELQERLQTATRAATDAAAAVERVDRDRATRATRLPEIPDELGAAKATAKRVAADLADVGAGQDKRLVAARRARLLAERQAARATVRALEAEAAYYEASQDLLTAQRDVAVRRSSDTSKTRKAWQRIVERARTTHAERAAREAEDSRKRVSFEELQPLAKRNAELARRLPELDESLREASRALERARRRLRALEERETDLRTIIDDVGLTDAVGKILRERGAWLKERMRTLQLYMSDHRGDLARVQVERFELDQQRAKLADLEGAVSAFLGRALDDDTPDARRDAIRDAASTLFAQQRDTIDQILRQSGAYLQQLREIKSTEERLRQRADALFAFIEARILWVRSAPPIWAPDGFPSSGRLPTWLASTTPWRETGRSLAADVRANTMAWLAAAGAWLALMVLRRRIARRLDRAGEIARDRTCASFAPTLAALLWTVLYALPIPLAVYLVGWRIGVGSPTDFTLALSVTLTHAGRMLAGLSLIRTMCSERGLATCHFGLSPDAAATARTGIMRIVWLLPLYIFVQLMEQAIDLSAMDSTGRGAYIVLSVLFGVALGRLLHPTTGLFAHGLRKHTALRWTALAAGVGFPLAVATLAATGYYLTALAFGHRVAPTLTGILGCLVAAWLAARYLRVSRRALLLREEGVANVEDVESDKKRARHERAEELSGQLLWSLFIVSIVGVVWSRWADVLPALGYWREFVLWTATAVVDGQETAVPVTIIDLLLSILLAVVTVIAARSVPGVLRVTVLRRLPEGDRIAFAKVAQYAIVFAGILGCLIVVRMQWSHLQWAVAGLSVGLGFGLQEIFANFISGLIILFERPIRVGDMVTVGQTEGRVAEIRVRSTTILDFDMRELIVPNKEFISREIVNWTLSSPVTRAVIPVSVSVEADPERVRSILLDVAVRNDRILDDPKPWAMFRAFGDSALEFKLMVYLGTRADWVPVVDGLHEDIVRAFRDAGIDFAFRRSEIKLRRPHEEEPWMPPPRSQGEPEPTPGA